MKEIITDYVVSLEQEIRKLCPQSEALFMLLHEMKRKAESPTFEDEMQPFTEIVDQFEDVLDVEVFWS